MVFSINGLHTLVPGPMVDLGFGVRRLVSFQSRLIVVLLNFAGLIFKWSLLSHFLQKILGSEVVYRSSCC